MISLEENFQNECLRPILKAQNDWIMAAFSHYLEKHKIQIGQQVAEEKLLFIDKIIKKDLSFRHFLVGMVVGKMSLDDFNIYQKSETEFNKRMVSMLIKRIASQLN